MPYPETFAKENATGPASKPQYPIQLLELVPFQYSGHYSAGYVSHFSKENRFS